MGRHSRPEDLQELPTAEPVIAQQALTVTDFAPEKVKTTKLSESEQRAVVLGTIFRIVGTPVVALLGLLNTAIIVKQTGVGVFGVVSLISTMSLLFPFADLGIGAVVTTASSRTTKLVEDVTAVMTIARAYKVLLTVAAALTGVCLLVMTMNWWGSVIGVVTGSADRWVITIAAIMFAVTIPAGLGIRILIGIDKNQLAVLILMCNTVFGLAMTACLMFGGVRGIWYAIPGVAGALAGNVVATYVALRLSGLTFRALRSARRPESGGRLLAGSSWMLIASIGLPLGLQTHRILLSHLSTPEELSRYALMAQVYALGWTVFSTAGTAYWPVFVKRRGDPEGSISMWRKVLMVFSVASVVAGLGIAALGPWATSILSSGEVTTSRWLAVAFGALLVAQCVHLPAGVLLTTPSEMRWQALCIAVMSVISLVGGILVAPSQGAAGVVLVTAAAVLLAQIFPDLWCVPRLVRRREHEPAATTPIPV